MLFNSLMYALFLPIVFFIYWLLPHKFRGPLLLVASLYFYMSWNPKYVFLILMTTVVSYFAAIFIERAKNKKQKQMILIFALFTCLSVLFVFKYFNFVAGTTNRFLNLISIPLSIPTLHLIIPLGISFYTFQTLSYVIDVYRGDIEAEKNFGIYATFISFFPQLVAGPIERTSNLLPQIKEEHKFDYNKAIYGMKFMLIGYYKKLVIADMLAQYVDKLYMNVTDFHGFDLALVMFFFTIQIYCDFSGYSDIAIGTAKLLGIDLTLNFCSPYFSASLKEFWSRWHISLSTWFRDYIYIPLGGNKKGKLRTYINLFLTFVISGLWHGANWTFVIWGAIHGIMQIIEKMFEKTLKPLRKTKFGKILSILVVFAFCNLSWVFFRAESLSDAIYVISNALVGITNIRGYLSTNLGISKWELLIIMGSIFVMAIYDFMNVDGKLIEKTAKWNKISQWVLYVALGLMIIFLSQKGAATEFVYFQF